MRATGTIIFYGTILTLFVSLRTTLGSSLNKESNVYFPSVSRRDGPGDPDFFALRGRRSSSSAANPTTISSGDAGMMLLAEELSAAEEEEERRAIARMLMAMYNDSLKREEGRMRRTRVRRDGKNRGKLPASIENFLAQRG